MPRDSLEGPGSFCKSSAYRATAITFENHSDDTHDSAVNMAAMAKARGWKRLVLVTDATHMRRNRAAFVHEGMPVSCEPTMMWRIGGNGPSNRLAKLGAIVHEYGGLLLPRARGWNLRVQWAFARRFPTVAGSSLFFACRGVAQPGRALGSGPRGRWFESTRPDHFFLSKFAMFSLAGRSVPFERHAGTE